MRAGPLQDPLTKLMTPGFVVTEEFFHETLQRQFYAGDTALHIAAAAYRTDAIRMLIASGEDVNARNRMGAQPLHTAAAGAPGSKTWNPEAQQETIALLIEAGANPNAINRHGAAPIHIAVRTRCAAAAGELLRRGADPLQKNRSGSTAFTLARVNSGRSGSGSAEARAAQAEILRLLAAPKGKTDGGHQT